MVDGMGCIQHIHACSCTKYLMMLFCSAFLFLFDRGPHNKQSLHLLVTQDLAVSSAWSYDRQAQTSSATSSFGKDRPAKMRDPRICLVLGFTNMDAKRHGSRTVRDTRCRREEEYFLQQ